MSRVKSQNFDGRHERVTTLLSQLPAERANEDDTDADEEAA